MFTEWQPELWQNVPVPCSAFAHHAYGDWKVLGPVILNIDGRLLAPTVAPPFPPDRWYTASR
jgi:hypothetical protein